jgi:hypothetical protein
MFLEKNQHWYLLLICPNIPLLKFYKSDYLNHFYLPNANFLHKVGIEKEGNKCFLRMSVVFNLPILILVHQTIPGDFSLLLLLF